MKIKVGGVYRNGLGERVEIVREWSSLKFPYRGGNGETYMEGGQWYGYDYPRSYDLIEEWVDEPVTGTLEELDVKVGDVVQPVKTWRGTTVKNGRVWTIIKTMPGEYYGVKPNYHKNHPGTPLTPSSIFKVISRASDAPKLFRDMTPEEKGALLLAKHEGRKIQFWHEGAWVDMVIHWWFDTYAYRVAPEPETEAIVWGEYQITFDVTDGVPDCYTIKMSE